MRKLSGVNVPHHKNTAEMAPVALTVPPEVVIPMSMHSGAPAKPVVAKGDAVKVGQLIGEAQGFVSSPVHASVSGTVTSVEEVTGLSGTKTMAVRIAADGAQTPYEGLAVPMVSNTEEFLAAVRGSGVVGLGGAAYPTAAKLTIKETNKIDYILVNGAECEPYVTSDTRTMVDDAEYVWEGMQLLMQYLKPGKVIICIEENKQAPIANMSGYTRGVAGMEVRVLPSQYPQGERKVLVYHVTGRIVPEGARLPDVGCVVINCTTVATLAKYIKTGEPLVSRCVTVDGPAVASPQNVISPIGAPVSKLLEFCGLKEAPKKVLLGGPMMGFAIPDMEMPVIKSTNGIMAFGIKGASAAETPCIKCARCLRHCPMNLMPMHIEAAYKLKKPDLLEKYNVTLCLECGCCAYSCPAKHPLMQTMQLAKQMLWDHRKAKGGVAG